MGVQCDLSNENAPSLLTMLSSKETEQITVGMADDLGAYEVYDCSDGDNNCFMRAVAFGLFGEPDHSKARRDIHEFSRKHEFALLNDINSVFAGMRRNEWALFQESILVDGAFNSSFTLNLLNHFLNLHEDGPIGLTVIYVSDASPDRNWIQSPSFQCRKRLVLASINENHWVTLQKKNDPRPRRVGIADSLVHTVTAVSSL
jgi:hypothetical protein